MWGFQPVIVSNSNKNGFIVKLTTTGVLDSTFGTNGKAIFDLGHNEESINDIVFATSNEIFAIGTRNYSIFLSKITQDGNLSTSFDSNGYKLYPIGTIDYSNGINVFLQNNELLLTGSTVIGAKYLALLKVNLNGDLIQSFGINGVKKIEVVSSTDSSTFGLIKTLIKNELIEIKDEFGEERKSPIKEATEAKVFSEEETLVTEPITVVLSAAGWIRSAKGHEIDPSSLSYRGEDVLQDYGRGKSNQVSVFLDSNGKAYSLASHSLPSARGMGDPITGRVSADSGVKFISSLIGNDEDKFMIMNTAGYGYISEFKNMVSNKKSGKAFMKIPHEADLLKAIKVRDDHLYIAAVSNIGRLLIFKIDELPILGKGKGNKIINIP